MSESYIFIFDDQKNMVKGNRKSPLYTSKNDSEKKKSVIKEKGKDSDGAFRAYNRIDTKRK
jgi:hypothetical protein